MRATIFGLITVCWVALAACKGLDMDVTAKRNPDNQAVLSHRLSSVREPALPLEPFRPGIGLGAGLIYAGASSPLRAFDGARGAGVQITLETHVTDRVVLDVRFGGFYTALEQPEEVYYPADDGDWAILSSAVRIEAAEAGRATWFWAGVEGSLHYAQMKNYDYVGSGFGVGPVVGVDLPARNNRLVTRLGGHLTWIWLDTDSADPSGPTFIATLGLDVVYRFRRT